MPIWLLHTFKNKDIFLQGIVWNKVFYSISKDSKQQDFGVKWGDFCGLLFIQVILFLIPYKVFSTTMKG